MAENVITTFSSYQSVDDMYRMGNGTELKSQFLLSLKVQGTQNCAFVCIMLPISVNCSFVYLLTFLLSFIFWFRR